MTNRTRPAPHRAFTLIELLLVMVILVVLAAIAGVNYGKYANRARVTKVKADLHQLGTALSAFQIDCGRLPTTDEGLGALASNPGASQWTGPYMDIIPRDPWDTPYVYQAPGEHLPHSFDLHSVGPDKQDGNEDDIGNWQS